jgi:hypothetical protein
MLAEQLRTTGLAHQGMRKSSTIQKKNGLAACFFRIAQGIG